MARVPIADALAFILLGKHYAPSWRIAVRDVQVLSRILQDTANVATLDSAFLDTIDRILNGDEDQISSRLEMAKEVAIAQWKRGHRSGKGEPAIPSSPDEVW